MFANTPRTARAVHRILGGLLKHDRAATLLLLTGRTREREAGSLRDEIREGAAADRLPERSEHFVVVATQTLEVGADVDFDCLVTESAGARAIIQRLGRLNRLGRLPEGFGVICHPESDKPSPLYGEEAEEVWRRVAEAAGGGQVNLAPIDVATVVGEPQDEPKRVGELLPSHLWEWAKTSQPPEGEAAGELFYEGFDAGGDASLVWRAAIPADGGRLVPAAHESESIELPVWELKDALKERGFDKVARLLSDRERVEGVDPEQVRPGDVVILPVDAGLYDDLGWNPEASGAVLDVSPLETPILLLNANLIRNLIPHPGDQVPKVLERLRNESENQGELDPDEEGAAVEELLRLLGSEDLVVHPWLRPQEWQERLDGHPELVRPKGGDPFLRWPAKPRQQAEIRSEAFEELSFGLPDLPKRSLRAHQAMVATTARAIAAKLGCQDGMEEAVFHAGVLHDQGKAETRFQRWLSPEGIADEPMAKSDTPRERIEATRVASGWPKGGRHELLSGRLAQAWLTERELACDPELVLHLVFSHHGGGRPLVRVVEDESSGTFHASVEDDDVEAPASLSVPDWGQPRRFRDLCERYGYWGLALLEAIVRLADHAASDVREVS